MSAVSSSRSRSQALSPVSQVNRRPNTVLMGAAAFIASESMFFVGLFLAYFYLRAVRISWPSSLQHPSLTLPLINTVFVGISILAITWAQRGITRGDKHRLVAGMAWAAFFGVAFMAVQSVTFAQLLELGLTPNGGSFGSTFYALLVFHVLRVFGGVGFMVIILIRALLGQFSPARRVAVQVCALYWYFLAAVWVVVFFVLYIVR